MININAILLGLAFTLTQVNGHFTLQYPPPVGPFNDDTEGTGPCGGLDPTFTDVTDFHVGGDAIAVRSTHPQANWWFRATLDKTAQGNWTNLAPEVAQVGLGDFCQQALIVPSSYVGKQGVVQIIQDAVDGALYQCAAVNFVKGSAASVPTACTNGTGVTATFMDSTSTTSAGAGAPASTSSTAPSATPTNAAMTIGGHEVFGALGAAAMLSAVVFALVL